MDISIKNFQRKINVTERRLKTLKKVFRVKSKNKDEFDTIFAK